MRMFDDTLMLSCTLSIHHSTDFDCLASTQVSALTFSDEREEKNTNFLVELVLFLSFIFRWLMSVHLLYSWRMSRICSQHSTDFITWYWKNSCRFYNGMAAVSAENSTNWLYRMVHCTLYSVLHICTIQHTYYIVVSTVATFAANIRGNLKS